MSRLTVSQRHAMPQSEFVNGKQAAEAVLPPDHVLGMRVPKGGSMCGRCDYLASNTTCGNPGFVKWNGSPNLPAPADEYCCDLYALPDADDGKGDRDPPMGRLDA